MDTRKQVYEIVGKRSWILPLLLVFAFGTACSSAALAATAPPHATFRASPAQPSARIMKLDRKVSKEVRHQLLMIPWYNVFDNLEYKVQGHTVTLAGEVVFPLTSTSVGRYIKGLPGVKHVVDHVRNLPVSPYNRQIRMAEFRALFMHQSPLFHYVLGTHPRIHIVENNGRVTLYGVVDSKADREFAGMRARTVPDVFSVKNKLRVG